MLKLDNNLRLLSNLRNIYWFTFSVIRNTNRLRQDVIYYTDLLYQWFADIYSSRLSRFNAGVFIRKSLIYQIRVIDNVLSLLVIQEFNVLWCSSFSMCECIIVAILWCHGFGIDLCDFYEVTVVSGDFRAVRMKFQECLTPQSHQNRYP